ncbi:MAG: hypothetical protein U0521_29300 [Anaerolineae bacterium]
MNEIVHLAWERFKVIAGIVGDLQGRAIVTLFYYTILIPFGLGARQFSDSLRIRTDNTPRWLDRAPVPTTLDDARRQG